MADFKSALKKTLAHEGGYVSDPDDAGGETYRGVSRRYHPRWPGWLLIDGMKDDSAFPAILDRSDALEALVERFYADHFWSRFWGDEIPNAAQAVAETLFDTAVNLGVHRAVSYLQEGLNALNRNGKVWSDLVVDGAFGPATLRALEGCLIQEQDIGHLVKIMGALRICHYLDYMKKSPVQEKYARGWLSRVKLEV